MDESGTREESDGGNAKNMGTGKRGIPAGGCPKMSG
jgi:hypothetical protein